MGWKSFKEKFGILHVVQVVEESIHIGSALVPDLATVDMKTGVLEENRDLRGFLLKHYPALAAAAPEYILAVLDAPDTFAASVKVHTYEGGDIVEKECEEPGWPNLTHDGRLMHDNMFSADRAEVVGWAKRDAASGIESYGKYVAEAEQQLAGFRSLLSACQSNLAKLEADHPAEAAG
jgi:hypothetical protein